MSIKLKIGWTDNNVIIEGVRIYKSFTPFEVSTLPEVYTEILDGSLFYEDFDVIDGQTYFYMLSCFLSEREVFTECFEVIANIKPPTAYFIGTSLLTEVAQDAELYRSALSSVGIGLEVVSWADLNSTSIRESDVIIITSLDDRDEDLTPQTYSSLIEMHRRGVPVVLMAYAGNDPLLNYNLVLHLGIGNTYGDINSLGSLIITDNTLSQNFSVGWIVNERSTSYYASRINQKAPGAITIDTSLSSEMTGVFLRRQATNIHGEPSPGHVLFVGWAWQNSSRNWKLSSMGLAYFSELLSTLISIH